VTKDDIIQQVGRRLTSISSTLNTIVGEVFDFVLADLASRGAISALSKEATFTLGAAGVYQYNTRTITGLAAPHYPYRVQALLVPAWGYPDGVLVQVDKQTFDAAQLGNTTYGRPRMWRIYPNETQLEMWPPVDAANAAASARVFYLAPPTSISGATEITEVRFEDLNTLVNGCLYWAARYLPADQAEGIIQDQAQVQALYESGAARMQARAEQRLMSPRKVAAMLAKAAQLAPNQ
jgi:hypothetical protein